MKYVRSYLKWAGSKYPMLDQLMRQLGPQRGTLVDVFAGSACLFLNTDYESYVVNDINVDLIESMRQLKIAPDAFIGDCEQLFKQGVCKDAYLENRALFNDPRINSYYKAVIFVYLNRVGFNGMFRVNKKGEFNVPYGSGNHDLPKDQMLNFAERCAATKVRFTSHSFEKMFRKRAATKLTYYIDPPYLDREDQKSFTSYTSDGFGIKEHRKLTRLCKKAAAHSKVIISNHDTVESRSLYSGFEFVSFPVRRSIAANVNSRVPVSELLAIASPA